MTMVIGHSAQMMLGLSRVVKMRKGFGHSQCHAKRFVSKCPLSGCLETTSPIEAFYLHPFHFHLLDVHHHHHHPDIHFHPFLFYLFNVHESLPSSQLNFAFPNFFKNTNQSSTGPSVGLITLTWGVLAVGED